MPAPVSLTAQQRRSGPGASPGCARGVGVVELDVARLQGQRAAVGHGVAGVHREVHEHLLDLARVGRTRPRSGASTVTSSTSSPITRGQHRLRFGHHGVQVEDPRLQDLAPAEGQQLPGEGGRAVGGVADLASCGAPPASPAARSRRSSSLYPMITLSRLLKSWATPPASWPMASIFCDWRSWPSSFSSAAAARLRSVMSMRHGQHRRAPAEGQAAGGDVDVEERPVLPAMPRLADRDDALAPAAEARMRAFICGTSSGGRISVAGMARNSSREKP